MLREFEGFDYLAQAHLLDRFTSKVGTSPTVSGSAGRIGGNGMRITAGDEHISWTIDDQATWVVGFAWKATSAIPANGVIMRLLDSGTTQLEVRTVSNIITLTRNGTVLGSGTTTPVVGRFYYIELKATIGNSASAEVRVNGVTEISVSAVDTQNTANATANGINFYCPNGGGTGYDFDDIYVCDGTDGTASQGAANNNFLGDIRVTGNVVSGAGANAGFTPLSSTNISNVDEGTPDDDTSYNYSSASGVRDTFTKVALPNVSSNIIAVQVLNSARKDDGGSRSLKPVIRIGSTNYVGGADVLGTDYVYHGEIFGKSPATGILFTKAEVDAAEIGYEVA